MIIKALPIIMAIVSDVRPPRLSPHWRSNLLVTDLANGCLNKIKVTPKKMISVAGELESSERFMFPTDPTKGMALAYLTELM